MNYLEEKNTESALRKSLTILFPLSSFSSGLKPHAEKVAEKLRKSHQHQRSSKFYADFLPVPDSNLIGASFPKVCKISNNNLCPSLNVACGHPRLTNGLEIALAANKLTIRVLRKGNDDGSLLLLLASLSLSLDSGRKKRMERRIREWRRHFSLCVGRI